MNYSSELLTEELSKVEWHTEIENIQELWNSIEQEILTIIDEVASLEEMNLFINRGKNSAMLKKKLNQRNYLLRIENGQSRRRKKKKN